MSTTLLFERILSTTKTADLFFSNRRCLRSRLNRSVCQACLDECRSDALKLDGRAIAFDQDKCTGCMRCVSSCPNDAFEGGLDLTHLLETLSSSGQIVLSCPKNAHFHQKLLIPCIGSLSTPLLAAMNSAAADRFFVDLSHCADCINKHCLTSFHSRIKTLSDTTELNGPIPLNHTTEIINAQPINGNFSRRSYLGMVKESLLALGREAIRAKPTERSSAADLVSKGPALNTVALHYAYRNSPAEDKPPLLSFFYTVSVTEQCTLCPGCQGICPSGALKRTAVKGVKRLLFTSSACNGCGLCQEFCPKAAITVARGFTGDPEKPLDLC